MTSLPKPLVSLILLLDRARSVGRSGGFNPRRLRRREKFRADYKLVADSLLKHVEFETAFDVGCANGFLMEPLHAAGKHVEGADLAAQVKEFVCPELRDRVRTADFADIGEGQWDLVSCVEVAEHIKPGRSEELVDTLARAARSTLYFSAAPPGQLGRGHVNLRPHSDWLGWFDKRGWQLDEERTGLLRDDLAGLKRARWLRGNSMILTRA